MVEVVRISAFGNQGVVVQRLGNQQQKDNTIRAV